MAKGAFHFKRFSVEQDGAAMKVGTDGIVLGSWTSVTGASTIMDAGAGNGYVGLMLLQRADLDTRLIGIELEENAARQCTENYATQPFPSHATAWQGSVQKAAALPQFRNQADLIISNPPFYRNKPKSPDHARNLARHDDTLTMGDLAKASHAMLREGGRLCTIWPMDRLEEWMEWGEGCGFQPKQTVLVQTMRHLEPKRFLSEWVKTERNSVKHQQNQLTLEGKATLDFTEEYLSIVRPYLRGT